MKRVILGFLSTCLFGSLSGAVAQAPAGTATEGAQVGKPAPAFTLPDTQGKPRSLKDAEGKFVVLEWTNYDCPFVRKQYDAGAMQKLQKAYTAKGVNWFSICSSSTGRQGHYSPEKVTELIKQNGAAPTAYLFDADGKVGKLYNAKTTPHMYIINPKGVLIYAGAIDDNPSADISDKASTNYVQKALDEAMANKPITLTSTQAYGCSIKYHR